MTRLACMPIAKAHSRMSAPLARAQATSCATEDLSLLLLP